MTRKYSLFIIGWKVVIEKLPEIKHGIEKILNELRAAEADKQ